MNRQTFTWGRSGNQLRTEEQWTQFLCLVGLFLAAMVLLTLNLGNLPLRDWDEGTVAQVAREIWQNSLHDSRWLFPTLWGEPYLNKPPLVHDLMALSFAVGGVNEWTARLPGAFLTACSVPLLYLLGREIFPCRLPSLFAALIYLTLLPVIRHGRLAMLDGAVLCFEILMIGCALRSRRDLRWSLGAGLGFALICLTKGIMGLLLAGITLAFLAWDTPRLLTSGYFWSGWLLGSLPAVAWYAAQGLHYGNQFLFSLMDQQVERIGTSLDNHQEPFWYYLGEILKYSWPWLLFSFYGLRLAWNERSYSWAKLVLVWSGAYFAIISLMATKLPWYIMPIYPALALAGGAILAEVRNSPRSRPYPRSWMILLGLSTVVMAVIFLSLYYGLIHWAQPPHASLWLILISLILTFAVTSILMARRSEEFISILFWGMYVSMLVFCSSPYWIWELNEAYPVKPVAQMIQKLDLPPQQFVYTSFPYERPSLNFYSERRIIPVDANNLVEHWQKNPLREGKQVYLLDRKTWQTFQKELQPLAHQVTLASRQKLAPSGDWYLITLKLNPSHPPHPKPQATHS
ncbi:ArnT family glycosyltransferase [Gloeothece verrucosa]|uniref:Glycosyl transferase family 39 n=1 Tax=Gloeothece verrucosa (strain PCC 7822) TaxID=497965 RepID=E0U6P6_GLOV7|nr:glycosyltransferase family 39 protein [Gloeothece verrucosa]ADN14805.1 glycosyl transferase family 39 [Gloeothece verrucosa PCC 7822]